MCVGMRNRCSGSRKTAKGRHGCTDVCFLTFEAATLMARLVEGKEPIIPQILGAETKVS